jgi:hypothetical protein
MVTVLIGAQRPGTRVTVTVFRDGRERELRLGGRELVGGVGRALGEPELVLDELDERVAAQRAAARLGQRQRFHHPDVARGNPLAQRPPECQLRHLAVDLAAKEPGLVIPFSEFLSLTEKDSHLVRQFVTDPFDCLTEVVRGYRGSIGAINVVSRKSYDLIGAYDEGFEGAWYDDDAMKIAFEICCGPTRWVDGPAHHLYHLSGGRGRHLTDEERAATMKNRARYERYQSASTADEIRLLTCPETGQ